MCKSCGSMHNILLCPRDKDEDHKVMSTTDTSNQKDHNDLTENENAYENNSEVNVYMVSKVKSGKMSTSKKGEKDTDKVVDNPIKNVIDSKEKEETVEDARKLAEVTKLF